MSKEFATAKRNSQQPNSRHREKKPPALPDGIADNLFTFTERGLQAPARPVKCHSGGIPYAASQRRLVAASRGQLAKYSRYSPDCPCLVVMELPTKCNHQRILEASSTAASSPAGQEEGRPKRDSDSERTDQDPSHSESGFI